MVTVRTSALARPLPDAERSSRGRFEGVYSLAFLLSALMLVFGDAAKSMVSIWLSSSVYHHGLVVAPISFWLIATSGSARSAAPRGDWRGVAVIIGASMLWLMGRAAMIDLFGHVAIVIVIIGAVIAVYGLAVAKRWSFPLVFLFFMVPVGAEFTPALQSIAGVVVAHALNLTGVATIRDGYLLTTPAGPFEIAESCAGLRFLLASAMISTLVSWRAFSAWPKRAAFVVAAMIAALLANWLRIYVIVLAATMTEKRFGVGPEHVVIGWIFYGALLATLIAFARRFQDRPSERAIPSASPARSPRLTPGILAAAIAFASATVLYEGAVVAAPKSAAPNALAAFDAPADFHETAPFIDWRAFAPTADAAEAFSYVSANGPVMIFVASFPAERPGAEIVSANVRAADGVQWRRIAVTGTDLRLRGKRHRARLETLANNSGERIDVVTLYRIDDQLLTSPLAAKLAGASRRLIGRPAPAAAFFIAAPASTDADPRAEIEKIAQSIKFDAMTSARDEF